MISTKPFDPNAQPGYWVRNGVGQVLAANPASGDMTWQSSEAYYAPMTKEKAEWWCEVIKGRAVECARQCPDARIVEDYHRRPPGQIEMWSYRKQA